LGTDVAIAVGVSALLCLAICPRTPKTPSHDDLLTNGPTMAPLRPVDAFAIYGVVRDGAPIGLDYTTDYDADVTLTVKDGKHVWTRKLEPGPHSVRLLYDVDGWKGSDVGLFMVQAVKDGKPSAVEVYSIGAGASAVGPVVVNDRDPTPQFAKARYDAGGWTGSGARLFPASTLALAQGPPAPASGAASGGAMAINNLSFGPSMLLARKESANFSYMREAAFDHVVADVLIYPPPKLESTSTGKAWVIDAKPIWRDQTPSVSGVGPSGTRTWAGLDSNRQVSLGVHRLQVRGWMGTRDQGWVAALSLQTVDVQ
jgi:hypothetical protein